MKRPACASACRPGSSLPRGARCITATSRATSPIRTASASIPATTTSVNFNRPQKVGSQYDYAEQPRGVRVRERRAHRGRRPDQVGRLQLRRRRRRQPRLLLREPAAQARVDQRRAAPAIARHGYDRVERRRVDRRGQRPHAPVHAITARRARRAGPKAPRPRQASPTHRPTTGPRSARRRGASRISGT